jgi:DNA-binding HxlR family transcriptional regulator
MATIRKRLPGLPIERTLGVISGRWKAVIIYVLLSGPKRICELEQQIAGLSQKVLIQQLRSLESNGVVTRRTYPDDPQRVDYDLTALGVSLKPLIDHLYEWGTRHAETCEDGSPLLPCQAVVRNDVDAKEQRPETSVPKAGAVRLPA